MRVLLSGYYGYGNLGDEAVLAGLAGGLAERGLEVCVLSGDPAATRALHGVRSADRYRGLPLALLRTNALVSGGGGLLQDRTSRRSLRYYLGVVQLAKRLGKRTCIYGQSIGPLSDEGARRVTRALRGVPVAVRDAASRALLNELGLEATRVADPALLLPCPRPARPRTADAPQRGPVLLIPRAGHPGLNRALAEAGTRLRDAGLPLAALGLHEREDAAAVAELASAVGAEAWHAATPDEALGRVATARYVLSVRLHGLIFAAVCEVGFAGLVYDPKVAGFLAEARAPAFEPPIDAIRLAELARVAAPPDASALAELKRRADEGIAWLARQLSENTPGVQQSSS